MDEKEIDPQKLRELNQALSDLTGGFNATSDALAELMTDLGKAEKIPEKTRKKREKAEDDLNEVIDDAAKKRKDKEGKREELFDRELQSRQSYLNDQVRFTKDQRKQLQDADEATKKAKERAKKLDDLYALKSNPGKVLDDMMAQNKSVTGEFNNKMLEMTKGSMGLTATYKLATAGLEGMLNATKVMTQSLYAGERGAKVGANAISAFADSVTTAMKGIGVAMMFIPGLGIASKIAGAAIALLGAAASAAAEANKIAAEQNDKLFDSFNKLSEAGLAGAKGMTGVFETVQTLGMTTAELEKFNQLLVSSSKDLKMFGGTTSAGAETFAGVAGEIVKSGLGQKLEMLGVTADAQREHTLKYMAQQTRLGMMQDKSQKDLARGAAAYIEELDKLAMLTGATRKEQEQAQEAVNAIDEIRAAMEEASANGDKGEQERLKRFYDLAVDLQQQGLTRGAAGAAKFGAAGGPTDEASAAFLVQMPKAIEAINKGMARTDILVASAQDVRTSQREFAGAKRVGADLSGLQTDKTGTQLDFANRTLKAQEEADKKGISVEKYLQEEADKRSKTDDQRTKDNVEASRLQQAAAQKLDSVVWTFNAAATLNKTASETFNSAVNKFNSITGAKPVAGGDIKTNVSSGGSTAPAPVSASSTPAPMANTGGGAATGNPNISRQASRSRARTEANASAATGGNQSNAESSRLARATPTSGSMTAVGNTPVGGVENLFTFGGDSGSKSNFEQLNSSVRARITNAATEFNKLTGGTININSAKRESSDQQRLWDESEKAGRPGRTAQNRPIAKPGTSKHERGLAVDIQNYDDPKAVAAMNSQGLKQTIPDDPVHFEMARLGGMFSGPDSGYPVMLHGREAVIPENKMSYPSNVENMTSGVTKAPLPDVASTSSDSATAILSDLYNIMDDKFSTMIAILSSSNDVQSELLKHSRV